MSKLLKLSSPDAEIKPQLRGYEKCEITRNILKACVSGYHTYFISVFKI